MKTFVQSLGSLWKQLGANQRVSLVVAALAVAGGLLAVVLWARRPEYQLLYARLGDKDLSAIMSYLETQNIPHEVTAGGTAVQVPSDQVYKIRMDLASKGIPSGDGVGFEIFDKGQFGLSDFVQRTNYIRAVQGELARTISQLQGVRAARVMIVQPENRLLLTDQGVKSTASVFVDLGGGRLDPDQVNAIRHLVANSVQGLGVDEVAVVDNHGRVLSEELKEDPTLATASSQIRYRQQVEDYFAHKVESMLAEVIGPGNAVVRVSADIETEATTLTEEKYDPDGQVVRTETSTDDTSNSVESHTAGGAVGVSANVPDKAAAANAAAASNPKPTTETTTNRKNKSTTYEINRVLTNVTRSPGTIRSLTASVLIAPRPAPPGAPGSAPAEPAKRTTEELNALRQLVINALGLKPAPGQSLDSLVTVAEMPFAAEPISQEVSSIEKENRLLDWVQAGSRYAGLAGAGIVLLVFMRLLSRQRPESVPVEVLALPADLAARARPSQGGITAEMLNEMIRQKPAHVGAALRDWMGTTTNANKG